MTTHEFNNRASQDERRRVELDTYLARAQADTDLAAGGRFKKEVEARVTGTPTYPPQPASSFWAKSLDEVSGPEAPLGYSVNQQGE